MLQASLRLLLLASSFAQVQTHAEVNREKSVVHGAEGQLILGWSTSIAKTNYRAWGFLGEAESYRKNLPALSALISPSVGVFVARNFAIGLQGDFGLVRAGPFRPWSLAAGPYLLAHVPIASGVRILPKVAVEYRRLSTINSIVVALDADLAVDLKSDFSLTFGPQIMREVYSWGNGDDVATAYGLKLGFLGWL